MTAPEPAGKAGPSLSDILPPEALAKLDTSDAPAVQSVEGEPAIPPPGGAEVERPTPFTIAKPVADFTILMADTAMRIENAPAIIGVQQMQAAVRELRSAVQRRDQLAVITNSITVAAFALRLFLMVTPHYQEGKGGEEEAQAEEAGAQGADAEVLTDGVEEGRTAEAPEGERGRTAQEHGPQAGNEDDDGPA